MPYFDVGLPTVDRYVSHAPEYFEENKTKRIVFSVGYRTRIEFGTIRTDPKKNEWIRFSVF